MSSLVILRHIPSSQTAKVTDDAKILPFAHQLLMSASWRRPHIAMGNTPSFSDMISSRSLPVPKVPFPT